MKNLKDIIIERLHLNKNTKIIYINAPQIDNDTYKKISRALTLTVNPEFNQLEDKLYKCVKNNNSVLNLLKELSWDKKSLQPVLDLWLIAIREKFNNQIEELGDIIDRYTDISLMDLHGYCVKTYNIILKQSSIEKSDFCKRYENYFNLYNIINY